MMLTNCVGVIDSFFIGEIKVKFKPTNSFNYYDGSIITESPIGDNMYCIGERIAQLIIMPIPQIEFVEADELSDSDRGEGGFGSSGK